MKWVSVICISIEDCCHQWKHPSAIQILQIKPVAFHNSIKENARGCLSYWEFSIWIKTTFIKIYFFIVTYSFQPSNIQRNNNHELHSLKSQSIYESHNPENGISIFRDKSLKYGYSINEYFYLTKCHDLCKSAIYQKWYC